MTSLSYLLVLKLIEPIRNMESFQYIISLRYGRGYNIYLSKEYLEYILKFYYGFSIIGVVSLVNDVYERFLYDMLNKERQIKWYDVKPLSYPYDPDKLQLIVGQVKNDFDTDLAEKPYYEVIEEIGLLQNIFISGTIGTGKTITAITQFAVQLIYYASNNPAKKAAMLFLDVKGNLYQFIHAFAYECGRWDDLITIELGGKWKYNPLHKPNLTAIELAHRIRNVLEMFIGATTESYWIDKAEDTIVELIKIIRIYNYGYVNFEELHNLGTKDEFRNRKLQELKRAYESDELNETQKYDYLTALAFFKNEYEELDPKAKNFIKSEITRMTQPFISSKVVKDTFCPSRDEINFYGFEDIIKDGKIVVWKINANKEPKIAKLVAAYLKLDYQKEVLITLEKKHSDPIAYNRRKVSLCDEYHEYCTKGDPEYISQSREAGSIMIVATQSYTNIKKALGNDETLTNMLLQSFVNKIWLRSDDVEYTIPKVLKQIGKVDKEKVTTSITESSRNSKVNYSLGQVLGRGKNLSTGTSISTVKEYLFDEVFLGQMLDEGQAVCFISDGKKIKGIKVVHLNKLYEGRILCEEGKIHFETIEREIFKNIGQVDLEALERASFPEIKEEKIVIIDKEFEKKTLNFRDEKPTSTKTLTFRIDKKLLREREKAHQDILEELEKEIHEQNEMKDAISAAVDKEEPIEKTTNLPKIDLERNIFD